MVAIMDGVQDRNDGVLNHINSMKQLIMQFTVCQRIFKKVIPIFLAFLAETDLVRARNWSRHPIDRFSRAEFLARFAHQLRHLYVRAVRVGDDEAQESKYKQHPPKACRCFMFKGI